MKELPFRAKFIKKNAAYMYAFPVENSAIPGTPDLHGITRSIIPIGFWIEVKVCIDNEPVHFQPYQPNWNNAYTFNGGNAFILILNNSTGLVYLFDASYINDLVDIVFEEKMEWITKRCLFFCDQRDLQSIGRYIKDHLNRLCFGDKSSDL